MAGTGFVAARGIRGALQGGVVAPAHAETAVFVQAALGKDGDVERGWVYQGQSGAWGADPAESEEQKERRLERLQEHSSGVEQRHLLGLHHLRRAWLSPDPSARWLHDAERELLQALAEDPEQAGAWNDLAVVYLSWASQHDRPRRLLDAYAASHAALALEPSMAEARFNQALVLEGLGLFEDAAATLDGYWPAWADAEKIASRQKELAAIDPVALREEFLAKLEKAAEAGEVGEFLKQAELFPQTARRWVEETLLPRWAEARLKGEEGQADQRLEVAKALGERLANPANETLKDPMLLESVLAITEAERNDGQRLEYLTKGHQAFGRGMQDFPSRLEEAQVFFEQAEENFNRGRSPFASWAAFYQGAIQDLQGDKPGALARFEGLQESGPRFPSVRLRACWGHGLVFDKLELLEGAVAGYGCALDLARGLEDVELQGGLGWLRVLVLIRLGREDDAWRSLRASLSSRAEPKTAIHQANAFYVAADRVRDAKAQSVNPAAPWQVPMNELQIRFRRAAAEAVRQGPQMAFVQNQLELAKTLIAADRAGEAKAFMDQLELELRELPADSTQERLIADALLAKSRLDLFPTREVERRSLIEAYETYERSSSHTFVIEAGLELARFEKKEGNPEAAQKWVDRCLERIELAVNHLEASGARGRYLRSVRSVYQTAFGLAFDKGDTEGLFNLFIRRAGSLRTPRSQGTTIPKRGIGGSFRPPAGDSGTMWVTYLELDEGRLLALTQRAGGIQATLLPGAATELARRVQELAGLRGSADSVRTGLSALYSALIAPIAKHLPKEGRLALSLDDSFSGIPFAGLWDESEHRYLVERFEIVQVAEPGWPDQSDEGSESWRPGEALVLAANKPASSWGLPELPEVESEARILAKHLPGALIRSGAEATVETLLRELPGKSVFHFAGHSLADPADASNSLLILGEGEGRSAVGLRELEQLEFESLRLIVLAGCETARSGTANLARSMAGSTEAAVIGSLWPVHDRFSRRFFEHFYEHVSAGEALPVALRAAQLKLLQSDSENIWSFSWVAMGGPG